MGIFAYLMILPVFLFVNCQNDLDDPIVSSEAKLTPDSKVLSLMKAAIISEADYMAGKNKESLSKSTDFAASADAASSDQCTQFQYPMTFDVYSGDNPNPVQWEINSDEELLDFIDMLMASSTTYEYYIYFPVTLLDTDGNETVLYSLAELEGTLTMAVEACAGLNDGSGTDGGTGSGSDGGTDGGTSSSTDGGTDGGTSGGTGSGSDDSGTDGGTDGGSDDSGTDGGTDGGSDDSSEGGSDESGSDSGSDDDSGEEGQESISEDEISDSTDNGHRYCDKKAKKVIICHKGQTICISVNAIWGHMQHHEEDYFGECEE